LTSEFQVLIVRTIACAASVSFLLSAYLQPSFVFLEKTENSHKSIEFSVVMASFWLLTILQLIFCRFAFGNYYTSDEFGFARAYSVNIGQFQPAYSGFTQGVAGLIYSAWYRIFGFSEFSARTLSTCISTVGAIFTYVLVKEEFGKRVAVWAALFLRLSSYVVLFSSLALETSFALACIPLAILLCMRPARRSSAAVLSGVLLGLSIFTYPGVPMFYFAWGAVAAKTYKGHAWHWVKERVFFLGAFAFVLFAGIVVHFLYFNSVGAKEVTFPLFFGGGNFSLEFIALSDSIRSIFRDLFWGGTTWYVSLVSHATFLDLSLWGAFAFGLHRLYRLKDTRLTVLFYAAMVCLVFNVFITKNVGMRRVIGILPILCFVAAYGYVALRGRGALAAKTAVLIAVLLNGALITPIGILRHDIMFESFPPPFPDREMESALMKGNVYIDLEEVFIWVYKIAILNQQKLIASSSGKKVGKIYFDLLEPPAEECLAYFTWRDIGEPSRVTLGFFKKTRVSKSRIPDFSILNLLNNKYRRENCDLGSN
jgi:hypothetical protein